MKVCAFVVSAVLGSATLAQAQQAIVSPGRSVDWTLAGVAGGVPNRTTICSTLTPGATAAQINSAIAACPSGQVVFLDAGTYNLTSGIVFNNKSHVTLRGAGADRTLLLFSGGVSCFGSGGDICFQNAELSYAIQPAHSATWTAGFAKGTSDITLSSTTGLVVGNYLVLDQLNDANSDTGSIWVCEADNVCADEGPSGAGAPGRIQEQRSIVTAINGSVVTISPPVAMPNWRASQSPRAWWAHTNVQMSGVENLSIDHTNSASQGGIRFMNALNCWVKGVRDLQSDRAHVMVWEGSHILVRDSYFYGTKNAVSQSYGIETYHAGNLLVENNIFQHVAAPIVLNGPSTGSVFSYNFAVDDFYTTSPNTMSGMVWLHAGGIDNVLFEGNEGPGWFSDGIHGTHHFATAFRNRFAGWETGKTSQTVPVIVKAFGRYFNMVGNVLGRVGTHDAYEHAPSGAGLFPIYDLNSSPGVGVADDPLVSGTLLRWGNYDTVTGTSRFLAGEVPSAISQHSNPVPSSQVLPTSFYLAGRPSWWGSRPWPAIGPDVTGGNGPGGHSYDVPAHACYDQTPKTGAILNFNAAVCYPAGTPPSPPTGLRIIR